MRLVDLDDVAGLERVWTELERLREVRDADLELRAAIIRRCEYLTPDLATPILAQLDRMHPGAVLEAYFAILASSQVMEAVRRQLAGEPWERVA